MLQSKLVGKKFVDLVRGMDQRATFLAKLERIDPVATQPAASAPDTKKTAVSSSNTYEDDPDFRFERKRGKRHVMNRLRNERLQGISILATPQADDDAGRLLIDSLDIGKRKTVTRVRLIVPKSLSQSSEVDAKLKGVREFLNMYLGPLIWANPTVDVSLTYDSNQTSSSLRMESEEGSGPTEINLDSLSRSEILQLILN
ncbi:uncharacterized protein MELLADRAFT_58832 [Melampsora larici-populina 98AG31]|uniref:Uncharacterized protein n=1 Tax=Melampsora larici-populina (strain 98AG31 / pathotype 3-4-7) TaxID=747676 RepID=F4R2Z4_MELLP|nr:uncharacterized protein MELLADRAFT_58832 [Melampsora larici-populina 98AG31]EGG12901.1 hypothetical protein MELLADRAFT_58832 [Melampsora larici-populina 98AG31]